MPVTKVDDIESFNKEVQGSEKGVIVKFEADWCSPCKAMESVVEEVARQNPDIKFISVDVEGDGLEFVLKEFGVRSLPTFIKLYSGEPFKSAVGTMSKTDLSEFVKSG